MTDVLCGIVVAIIIGACLWAYFHAQSANSGPTPGEAKLDADFDAKKKAEAQRIDQEDPNALLNDINGRGPRS